MAYALRYYKELAQADGGVIRLEIHKKDSTTSAVEIGAVVQGLSLEIQGQQDDIDTPIQKTSLHMTFVDASDIENGQKNGFWEEFYTPDALMWKVVLKAKDAGETSFRTTWGGYVTPDSFSEDLVYRGSVSITARDNIGHMQDFPFDALGDADGLISLYNLVSMGWEKIQSPMKLSWKGTWLDCSGSIAYNTLMNVSQFKDGNWYKAIETALASYGAVMRYVGNNTVIITTLRSLPGQGGRIDDLPHINPLFVTGATRELVPAVKRIEESVDYELEDSWSIPQIQPSDYTGMTYTYRCKVEGEKWGTVEHDAPVWAIPINNERGWDNFPSESLFFNIDAYEVGYFSDYRGLGEEMKRYMYIAANNMDDRSVWYSKQITCADVSLRIKFGLPVCLNRDSQIEQMSVFALKSIRYTISLKKDGSVLYYAGSGTWQVDEKILEKTYDISASETEFVEQIGMDDNVGICDLVFEIKKIEYAKTGYGSIANIGLYACIQDIAFTTSSTSSLRETNTVNTSYNADNNVILSRDPELGPAFDKVALPAFIKNGIFYRNADDEILPARLWSWGGSEQQMAVWNHLQLLCYYAKPNNLISGTIVNADITRVAAIYEWNHAEHILVSGRYNFLNGHIEGAVLREFARYEDMWSEVAGAAMPETEQDSRSNVEGGASSSSSPSTYTATQNVNIGTGGGASSLRDLLDVDVSNAIAQSLLYYDGAMWVDMSLATLMNPYLKKEASSQTIKGDIIIEGNLIVAGDTSSTAKGSNSGTDGALIGVVVNGTQYKDETNGMLDLSTLMNQYALATAIPTSLPASDVYPWAKKSSLALADVPDLSSKYLSVNGGTIKNGNNGTPLVIDTTNTEIGVPFRINNINKGWVGHTAAVGTYLFDYTSSKFLGVKTNGTPVYYDGSYRTLYHTGNFNPADYLPLTGGTITRSDRKQLLLKNSNASGLSALWIGGEFETFTHGAQFLYDGELGSIAIANFASYKNSSKGLGALRITKDNKIQVGDVNFSEGYVHDVIHSGNIDDYAILYKEGISVNDDYNVIGYGQTSGGWPSAGPAMIWGSWTGYRAMLHARNGVLRFNSMENSALTGWKTIAFTDSNVASATKLQTARTIWGQSFDGTGNVGGSLLMGYNSIFFGDNSNNYFIGWGGGNMFSYNNWYGHYFSSNGTERMRITAGGNVLIGTTTDSGYKLDVNGTARISGAVTMSSTLSVSGTTFRPVSVDSSYNGITEIGIGNKGTIYSGFGYNGGYTFMGREDGGGYPKLALRHSDGEPVYSPNNFTTVYRLIHSGGGTIDGNLRINGNLVVSGDTSTGSDIRFKDKLSDHSIALSDIAEAPLFTFRWNDREDDSVHLGSSAQYWEKVAPWLVKGEDFKTLDYSTLGVAIGISLANKAVNHEERIKILEKENKALKEEIRRIHYGS